MRTGPPAHTQGCYHETALYGSDAELLDVLVPFLLGGIEAGEPTLAALDARNTELVLDAVGPVSGVTFLSQEACYVRPAATIRAYRATFEAAIADGAEQIRVVGDVPTPGTGASWDTWARYEAAANVAFAPYPVWGLCPYDTRTASEDVLADVLAAHPHVADPAGHHANPRFVEPVQLMASRPAPAPDPLQDGAPLSVAVDPAPGDARAMAQAAARRAELDRASTEDLLVVVSELVTNGHRHGSPPVTLELWAVPGRVVASVSDAGPGPSDPFAGLQRADRAFGGMGLWIAHQLADEVVLAARADAGFTVRASVTRR